MGRGACCATVHGVSKDLDTHDVGTKQQEERVIKEKTDTSTYIKIRISIQ